jgi:hypothetical protein
MRLAQSGRPLVTRVASMSSMPEVKNVRAVASGWAELALAVGVPASAQREVL